MFKNNEDLKIWEQKNKDIFITIIFIKEEKNLISLNSLICHPIEGSGSLSFIFFWDFCVKASFFKIISHMHIP